MSEPRPTRAHPEIPAFDDQVVTDLMNDYIANRLTYDDFRRQLLDYVSDNQDVPLSREVQNRLINEPLSSKVTDVVAVPLYPGLQNLLEQVLEKRNGELRARHSRDPEPGYYGGEE